MTPYLANFWHGVRIALFRRVRPGEFRADWVAFWIGILVLGVIQMATGYVAAEPPVYFNPDAFQSLALMGMLYLACGFAGALLLRDPDLQRRVPVLLIYASILPMLTHCVVYEAMRMPWWAKPEDLWAFYAFVMTWLFLASYRALDLRIPPDAVIRQYLLAALAVGVVAAPPWVVYMERFFLTDYSGYERTTPFDDLDAEPLLQNQHHMLDKALSGIAPAKKGRTDVFVVSFGAFGSQDVFKKEAMLARETLSKWFGDHAQGIALINNPETAEEGHPLASRTNLRDTLNRLGQMANTDEDILVLYMTSHGYQGGALSVDMGPVPLLDRVPPDILREMLDESGFKYRVIMVSACYSGGVIGALKDDNTMIMTAAAANKRSFGCSDDAELTYFGKALLADALPHSATLAEAFEIAREVVKQREKAEGVSPPSEPQIYIGSAIAQKLQKDQ